MAENVNNNITEEERLRVEEIRKAIREELKTDEKQEKFEKAFNRNLLVGMVGFIGIGVARIATEVYKTKKRTDVELKRLEDNKEKWEKSNREEY